MFLPSYVRTEIAQTYSQLLKLKIKPLYNVLNLLVQENANITNLRFIASTVKVFLF